MENDYHLPISLIHRWNVMIDKGHHLINQWDQQQMRFHVKGANRDTASRSRIGVVTDFPLNLNWFEMCIGRLVYYC